MHNKNLTLPFLKYSPSKWGVFFTKIQAPTDRFSAMIICFSKSASVIVATRISTTVNIFSLHGPINQTCFELYPQLRAKQPL